MTHGMRTVAQTTLDRMLEALKAEADWDGLVTITDAYIAEKLGLNHTHVWLGVQLMLERGVLTEVGRTGSRRVRMLQISEEYL